MSGTEHRSLSDELGFHTPDVSTQAPTKAELGSPIKIAALSINVLWYQHLVREEQHPVEVVLDEWGDVALERMHERPATPYLCMINRVPVLLCSCCGEEEVPYCQQEHSPEG